MESTSRGVHPSMSDVRAKSDLEGGAVVLVPTGIGLGRPGSAGRGRGRLRGDLEERRLMCLLIVEVVM